LNKVTTNRSLDELTGT